MILKVKNKEGKDLGTFEIIGDKFNFFEGEKDIKFVEFIEKCFKEGVSSLKDVYDLEKNNSVIVLDHTNFGDSSFPYALKQFLEREGYLVSKKYSEVEEEIKKLLESFSDDNPNKKDILKRLFKMSYLEQTMYLEGLKKIEGEF